MNRLPYDDELNIGYLGRLFDNTSNCYKFFWFRAILEKLSSDKTTFTYDELINEMIADAWYMVSAFRLRLGPNGVKDNLEEAVKRLGAISGFIVSEKKNNIIKFLENTNDRELMKCKYELTLNVPYRIHSPFFDEIKVDWNKSPKDLAEEINRQKRLLYYFGAFKQLSTSITINDDWVDYLLRNKEILTGWLELNLINYLQRRNPSVPGIADKIHVPEKRDIKRVGDYWKKIITLRPDITDIYGHVELENEAISIDHFVPWQYVSHDELWNLHPTTKSINSSKSNGLPNWDMYFIPFCKLEYLSYSLAQEKPAVREEFNKVAKYHLNNEEIMHSLYCDGLSESEFSERLSNVIRPVYNDAKNNGFKDWKYEEVSCR